MFGDQPFWAGRVRELSLGASIPIAELSAEGLASALEEVNEPAVAERAGRIAGRIGVDGVEVTARYLADRIK